MMECVLLADDADDMRLLLETVFTTAGIRVDGIAETGDEALAMWRASGDRCAIVLDQRMPGMTGLEVAEQILAEQPNTTIVLFSAHLDEQIRERARELGITACVSKEEVIDLPNHPAFQRP